MFIIAGSTITPAISPGMRGKRALEGVEVVEADDDRQRDVDAGIPAVIGTEFGESAVAHRGRSAARPTRAARRGGRGTRPRS